MADSFTPKQTHYFVQLARLTIPLPDTFQEGENVPGPWNNLEAYENWIAYSCLFSKETKKYQRRREVEIITQKLGTTRVIKFLCLTVFF